MRETIATLRGIGVGEGVASCCTNHLQIVCNINFPLDRGLKQTIEKKSVQALIENCSFSLRI